MKIAFTGSSGTGKTRLANELKKLEQFQSKFTQFITVDARKILTEQGNKSVDEMIPQELESFQLKYFAHKTKAEKGKDNYLTDRSFIDLAAYWIVQVAPYVSLSKTNDYIQKCCYEAQKYNIHFYFPYGIIEFESDGYRSESAKFHKDVDDQIRKLLNKNKLKTVNINDVDINERKRKVIDNILKLKFHAFFPRLARSWV
jgi:nicotinamide riboside kinase